MVFRMGNWYGKNWPSSKWAWKSDCVFDAEGNKISGCRNIRSIKVIRGEQNSEFGYHYKTKSMWVKITVDTKELRQGSYYAKQYALVKTKDDSKWFSSGWEKFKTVAWKKYTRPSRTR